MYKIILISNSSPSSWKEVGILQRKDFNVVYEKNFEEAFQKLCREKYDLFIAEEFPYDDSFLVFINKVLNQLKVNTTKGIIITSTSNLSPAGIIKVVLKTPLKPEDLDNAIANILNLKKRIFKRCIVRMHLGFGEDVHIFKTCTTINLNKGGMLIETSSALPIGKVYWWTFQGVKELEGLSIKGKIVSEMPQEGFSLNFRYGVQFLDEFSEAAKKIEEFLREKF